MICLFQSGAPSQLELFDYKPKLKGLHGTQLPSSVRQGPPLAGMPPTGREDYKVTAPFFNFQQSGQSGTWISELLPHTAKIVDDIAIIRSVQTEAANHEPQRGIEAELVRYPRDGHGFSEPRHKVDAATRTVEWFDRFR